MIRTVNDLFEQVKNTIKRKKIQHKYFYVDKYLQPIESIMKEIQWNARKWKVISQEDYKKFMKLPEYYIDGYGNKAPYEINHLLIEAIRIPSEKNPNLSNIVKIASIVGTYQAITLRECMYDTRSKLDDFILKEDTNINLNHFFDPDTIGFISKYLGK